MFRINIVIATMALISSCTSHVTIPPPESQEERETLAAAMAGQTTFVVKAPDAEGTWTRGKVWVEMYSGSKIQSSTDVLIETYPARSAGSFGYRITKTKLPDSTVSFTVTCSTVSDKSESDKDKVSQNAHLAAYYMSSGKVSKRYIYGSDK